MLAVYRQRHDWKLDAAATPTLGMKHLATILSYELPLSPAPRRDTNDGTADVK
jgi:hypothetical protein